MSNEQSGLIYDDSRTANLQYGNFKANANSRDECHIGPTRSEANHKIRYMSHFSPHQTPGRTSQPQGNQNSATKLASSSDRANATCPETSMNGSSVDTFKDQHTRSTAAQKKSVKHPDLPFLEHSPGSGIKTMDPEPNHFDTKATQSAGYGRPTSTQQCYGTDVDRLNPSKRPKLHNQDNSSDQHYVVISNTARKPVNSMQGNQQQASTGTSLAASHSYQRNSGIESSSNSDALGEIHWHERIPQTLSSGRRRSEINHSRSTGREPRGILKNQPIIIPDDDDTANGASKTPVTVTQATREAAISRIKSTQLSASLHAAYHQQSPSLNQSREGYSRFGSVYRRQPQGSAYFQDHNLASKRSRPTSGNAHTLSNSNARMTRSEDLYDLEQKYIRSDHYTEGQNVETVQRIGFYYDSDSDADCAVEDIMRERNQVRPVSSPKSTRTQQVNLGQLESSTSSTTLNKTGHSRRGSNGEAVDGTDSLLLQAEQGEAILEIETATDWKANKPTDSRAAKFLARLKENGNESRPKVIDRTDKSSDSAGYKTATGSGKGVRISEEHGKNTVEASMGRATSHKQAHEPGMKSIDGQRSKSIVSESEPSLTAIARTNSNISILDDAPIKHAVETQAVQQQIQTDQKSATSTYRGNSNNGQNKAVYKQDWSVETVPITEAVELMGPNKPKVQKAKHASTLKPPDSSNGLLNHLRRESQKTAATYTNGQVCSHNCVSTGAKPRSLKNDSNRSEGTDVQQIKSASSDGKLPKHRGALHPSSITDEDWLLVELRRRGYTWSEVLPEWESVFGKTRTIDWMQKRYRNMLDTFPECEADKFEEPVACKSKESEREKSGEHDAKISEPQAEPAGIGLPMMSNDHPTTGGKTITKAMERMIREGILESERNRALDRVEDDIGDDDCSPSPVCDADTVHYAYFVKRRVVRGFAQAESAWLTIGPTYPTILAANQAAGLEILKEREGENVWPIGEWSCVCNESTEYLANWIAKAIDGDSAVEVVVDRVLRTWQDGKKPTKQDKTSWLRRLNAWDVWETRTDTRETLNTAATGLLPGVPETRSVDLVDLDDQLDGFDLEDDGKAVKFTAPFAQNDPIGDEKATRGSSCSKVGHDTDEMSLDDDLDALFNDMDATANEFGQVANVTAVSQCKTVSTRTYPMSLATEQSNTQGEEPPMVAVHTTRDSANSIAVRRMMEIRRSIIPEKQRYKIDTVTGLQEQQEKYEGQLQELEMEAAMDFGPGLFEGDIEWAEWELGDGKRVVVPPKGSKAGHHNREELDDKAVAKIDVRVVVQVVRRVLTGPCNI